MSAYLLRAEARRNKWRVGVVFRKGSLWIGVHYSPFNGRFCINLIPCLTVWVTKPGGNVPCQNN